MTMQSIHTYSRIVLLCCILASCTKADIDYRSKPSTEGWVQIYPHMSEYTLPAVQYHFYNTDGETEYTVHPCDGNGNYEGMQPVGTYQVMAVNTAAANVTFADMHAYEQAAVYANRVGTQSREATTFSFLEQPGDIYSTVVEELVVVGDQVVRKEPNPALLTKHLNLIFFMRDGLDEEVDQMPGVLPGIYPAVLLHNGQGLHTEQCPGLAVAFDTQQTGIRRIARLHLLGLLDPAYGEVYRNQLELDLVMTTGFTLHITFDLSGILSYAIEKNNGILPPELYISFEIRKNGIGVSIEVSGWAYEGEWIGEINVS